LEGQRGPDPEPNLRSGEGCVKSKALLICIIGANEAIGASAERERF